MLVFWQDYIRYLEKEEEEQKKIQKVCHSFWVYVYTSSFHCPGSCFWWMLSLSYCSTWRGGVTGVLRLVASKLKIWY